MFFFADLHVHSKFSRATGRDCDLPNLSFWAQRKGLSVIGTGDFTNPGWMKEIRKNLKEREAGLFGLNQELERNVQKRLPPCCHRSVRFLLSVEISTVYKKKDKTRKIHHLVSVPSLEAADRLSKSLSRIGNLLSDGRPILGLDSRDLLEIVLESDPLAFLIPAHIWTPWFSVLGSRSGFDSIEACYEDLSGHIFALETGLSSDPPMNWRVSSLDRFRLVSNSDAHSPKNLGREACAFDCELSYSSIRQALQFGQGYQGTVEFFPEEGKYHLDGHRNCGVRLTPQETRKHERICPVCGKEVTVGVMHRVDELADRTEILPPKTAGAVRSLVPLPEVLAEILGVGSQSQAVQKSYEGMLSRLGPELFMLLDCPLTDLERTGSAVLGEAISRLRKGQVFREAGYDGEYGVIRCFDPKELSLAPRTALLFELPQSEPVPSRAKNKIKEPGSARAIFPVTRQKKSLRADADTEKSKTQTGGAQVLDGLDPAQRTAAQISSGPLLIVAGPGTGKTKTLIHRLAYLIHDLGLPPESGLTITFTRKAAVELRERLRQLIPDCSERVPVLTFHGLGYSILRENRAAVGFPEGFRIAEEKEREELLLKWANGSRRKARKMAQEISGLKRTEEEKPPWVEEFLCAMRSQHWVDFDDLIGLALQLLQSRPEILTQYRERYSNLSIDEYQDLDELQYRLVKLLVPPEGNLCAIGDPDQAIYGFRGAQACFFERFLEDFPKARVVRLSRNYRSTPSIVDASVQVISRGEPKGRELQALRQSPDRVVIHPAKSDRAEAEFVIQSIEQMLGGHNFFSIDSGRGISGEAEDLSFSDFAVLYRTESQADVLVEAFLRSGIPFCQRSHERLMHRPAIRRLMEKLEEQPQDDLFKSLQKAAEYVIREGSDQENFNEALVWEALESLSILAKESGEDRERFLSCLSLGVEVDTLDPRADRVSLLTLHASKGLEFRVVFLTGLEDGILPLRFGKIEPTTMEEERRLFFVGMTRAVDRLFLSWAQKRAWRGKLRARKVSPFVLDIQEQLLERRQMSGRSKRPRDGAEQLGMF